jgi:hypothetical protein
MESLHPELLYIADKFPEQSDKIAELYKNDSDFRALCKDYFLCIKILRQYQNEFGEKQNIIKEYDDTRKDLERELQDFIGNKK